MRDSGEQLGHAVQWDGRAERTHELHHFPRANLLFWKENAALPVWRSLFRSAACAAWGWVQADATL